MKKTKKRFAVLVLIAVHVSSSLFMQYSHQHILNGSSDGHQTIQNHGCGSIEIHPSLEDCRHCLLCPRDTTSSAVLEFSSAVPASYVQLHVDFEIIRILPEEMHVSEPDRGPPSFSA